MGLTVAKWTRKKVGYYEFSITLQVSFNRVYEELQIHTVFVSCAFNLHLASFFLLYIYPISTLPEHIPSTILSYAKIT